MRWSFLVLALVLTGCGFTPEGDLARVFVKDKGAQAADEGRRNAVWWLCNGESIGAIRRWVGNDAELAAAYNRICSGEAGDAGLAVGAVERPR